MPYGLRKPHATAGCCSADPKSSLAGPRPCTCRVWCLRTPAHRAGRCTPCWSSRLAPSPNPDVLAERESLAGDVVLVSAAAVVMAVTPELVAEPATSTASPSLTRICSVGWSPVGRPGDHRVTDPVDRFTLTMREDIVTAAARSRRASPWFESVANNLRRRDRARKKARWQTVGLKALIDFGSADVGLPIGRPSCCPLSRPGAWCEWIRGAELADALRLQRVSVVLFILPGSPSPPTPARRPEVVLAAGECHVGLANQARWRILPL